MTSLTREKLQQAAHLVRASDLDVWITFVRETGNGGDPVLPLILDGGLTWQSALMVFSNGKKIAIVGNYDADPLIASGDWDEVIGYVQGISEPLINTLGRNIDSLIPRIGLNFSMDDCKADGLSHGMYQLLKKHLAGTVYADSLFSAEAVVSALRAQKTPTEIARIKAAILEGDDLFKEIENFADLGVSERAVYNHTQKLIDSRGLGYGWDRAGNPIVNSGPNSMIGHGVPSDSILIEEGHIFHVDLGVIRNGYSSDIQRIWYVGDVIPADVKQAFDAVNRAIDAGAAKLAVGVEGWEVDAAARASLVADGYPEYMHAFGHQVGRAAHDGGSVLGPKWDRYGTTVTTPIREHEVYTLELGITVPGRGYLGLEEIVQVEHEGVVWLSDRQTDIKLLPRSATV